MKKCILVLICLAMFTGCSNVSKKGMVIIQASDAVETIENKESMILLVGKTDCDACKNFQKVLDEFLGNYDITIHEMFLDKEDVVVDEATGEETSPDYAKLEAYTGIIAGTPSVFFIKDGKIVGTFTGTISYDSFRSKVEKYGFLPA